MIAITFALPAESSDFVGRLEKPGLISREGVEAIRGRLHDKPLTVIHTGVGKKICRERLTVLLRRERFQYLISAGFAGALEKDLRVGHLLVAENFSNPQLLSSPDLDLADEGTFLGRLLTVTRIIESTHERESLNQKTGAAAVDMETETIAELCAAHDLPMLSLRAISDTASESFPAPAHVLFDVAKQKTDFIRLAPYLLIVSIGFGNKSPSREECSQTHSTKFYAPTCCEVDRALRRSMSTKCRRSRNIRHRATERTIHLSRRLDVHQHIGNPSVGLFDRVLHLMRDVVTVPDGYSSIHADVQIDVERDAHFANETFFDIEDAGDRGGRALNRRHDFAARRGIEHLVQRGEEKPISVCRDDRAGKERSPSVGALPFFAADQCDRNSNECGGGS
jgi:adenosylhomocysteine nucleosidase